jgi:hypothetical protein
VRARAKAKAFFVTELLISDFDWPMSGKDSPTTRSPFRKHTALRDINLPHVSEETYSTVVNQLQKEMA